jgi:protein-L-isoaspartate(D-aspartate) O-methyltransferase
MIIPVGSAWNVQRLVLAEKDSTGKVTTRSLLPVRFVPMTRKGR